MTKKYRKSYLLFIALLLTTISCGSLQVGVVRPTAKNETNEDSQSHTTDLNESSQGENEISPTIENKTPDTGNLNTVVITPTPTPFVIIKEWKTYHNPVYGFSINYPSNYQLTTNEENTFISIGENIYIRITDFDPFECRGDCPIVDSTQSTTLSGLEATKITGYIGSVGGYVPQRYISYIVKQTDKYYNFTLYAVGLNAHIVDFTKIEREPLIKSDIEVFEQILGTLAFND